MFQENSACNWLNNATIKNKKGKSLVECDSIVNDVKIRKTKTREVIEFFVTSLDNQKNIARYYISKKNKTLAICEIDEILVDNDIKMVSNLEFISNKLLMRKLKKLIGKKVIYHEKYKGFYLIKELLPLKKYYDEMEAR